MIGGQKSSFSPSSGRTEWSREDHRYMLAVFPRKGDKCWLCHLLHFMDITTIMEKVNNFSQHTATFMSFYWELNKNDPINNSINLRTLATRTIAYIPKHLGRSPHLPRQKGKPKMVAVLGKISILENKGYFFSSLNFSITKFSFHTLWEIYKLHFSSAILWNIC